MRPVNLPPTISHIEPEPLLTQAETCRRIRYSKSYFWKLDTLGFIPVALDLGGKAARYRLSDVIDALNARKDEIRQALDDDRAARKQAAKVAAKSTPSAH